MSFFIVSKNILTNSLKNAIMKLPREKEKKKMFHTNEIIAFYFKAHPSVSYETIAATLKLVYDLTDKEIEEGYKIFKETLDGKR